MTCTSAAGMPRPRPSGPGSRVAPTRRAGRPPSKRSPTATSTRWRAASGGWPRRWLGAGDREQATAAARAAHATATTLGAAPLQSALLALARRGRLDLGVDLPAQRALAGLTPRELEVLRLLVEGRSNRQIAEQLFISGKTASVHVTNLLAKLGVHSRLEAAALARRLGLEQPAGLES